MLLNLGRNFDDEAFKFLFSEVVRYVWLQMRKKNAPRLVNLSLPAFEGVSRPASNRYCAGRLASCAQPPGGAALAFAAGAAAEPGRLESPAAAASGFGGEGGREGWLVGCLPPERLGTEIRHAPSASGAGRQEGARDLLTWLGEREPNAAGSRRRRGLAGDPISLL